MWAFRFPPEGPLRNKHRRHISYKSPRDVVTLGAPAASSLQAWVGWGCTAFWRLLPAGINCGLIPHSSNQISGPSLLSFFLHHTNFNLAIPQVCQNQTHNFSPTWLSLLSLDATLMKGNPGPTRETWKSFLPPPHAASTSQGLPHSEVTLSYPYTWPLSWHPVSLQTRNLAGVSFTRLQ